MNGEIRHLKKPQWHGQPDLKHTQHTKIPGGDEPCPVSLQELEDLSINYQAVTISSNQHHETNTAAGHVSEVPG